MNTSTSCVTNLVGPIHVMTDAHKRWLLREIRRRLAEHPGRAEVSERTSAHRVDSIARTYVDLWCIGYRIERVESLAPRHLIAVLQHWKAKGLARSTVAVRWSYLSIWCRVIGKNGAQPKLADFWPATRRDATCRPSGNALPALSEEAYQQLLDVLSKRSDPTAYWLTRCVRELHLTREEALLFAPDIPESTGESWVTVSSGKRRRQRVVLIDTPHRVALVKEVAQRVADTGRRRLGWQNLPLDQALRRYSNAIAYALKSLPDGSQEATC